MKWVTRNFLHFDRVACVWLIKRFIDPSAEFQFVAWGEEDQRPADAIAFSIPGAEFGPHDERGSTFSKIIAKRGMSEPALLDMVRVVDLGVAYVMSGYRPLVEDELGQIAVGLLAVAEGLQLMHDTDAEIAKASMPIYDAFYVSRHARALVCNSNLAIPEPEGLGPTLPTQFLRRLVRKTGSLAVGSETYP